MLRRVVIICVSLILVVAGSIAAHKMYLTVRYPQKYEELIQIYSQKYNVDSALVFSVINTESGFDATATSPAGAIGLMQLMPTTAQWLAGLAGYSGVSELDYYDPTINIECGVYYLRYLLDKFPDITAALASYNAGEGNVAKWLDGDLQKELDENKIPFKETKDYVRKVNESLQVYSKRPMKIKEY